MEWVLISSIISLIALLISAGSFYYTYKQNKRKIDVNIQFDLSKFKVFDEIFDIEISLSAHNSGYRSVALLSSNFFANGKIIEFDYADSHEDPNKKNSFILDHPYHDKYPCVLKEGEISITSINAEHLASALFKRGFKDTVIINGEFITANQVNYKSNSLEFNLNDFKI